jgi:integrase
MSRVINRLTAVTVTNARAKGLYPDGGGLYLRVTSTGTKSWILRYSRDGKTHDMGLGPAGSISLARARELTAEAHRRRLQGLDPINARADERAAAKRAEARGVSFKVCAEQMMDAREIGWRNTKHRKQWRSSLLRYAYPVLGEAPVTAIDTALILKVLEPIWATKTQTANRIRGRMESVLDWAKARDLREGENVARWRGHLDQLLAAPSKVRSVRHHPALSYAELPAFLENLRSKDAISRRALEFVVLTAVRTREGIWARWDEIDFGARMWVIPAQRMKGGREHRVPLSTRAIAILKEMQEIRENDFLFPGLKQGQPLSAKSLLILLRDLHPGITTHGFRSTFKDWAAECTHTPNFVSEAALAHVVADKVEAAYRRADLIAKRRKLMDAWDRYCSRPASADVVILKPRKRV